MLTQEEYIRLSLDLNLFFLRIMKEHSFFLEAAFTERDKALAQRADQFKLQFEYLLNQAVILSSRIISREDWDSGQYVTIYTLAAEQKSQFYTGIAINSAITQQEMELAGIQSAAESAADYVNALNNAAMTCVAALISFKTMLLEELSSCRIFLNTYWLLLDHILREAKFYYSMLGKLQNRMEVRSPQELAQQEAFWNRIMAEHSKFIRGLLDPTEEALFVTADTFGREFDVLTAKAIAAQTQIVQLAEVTAESLEETKKVSGFNAAGTNGLLQCKIKAIIVPLLGDHVLREANHFIHVLQTAGV
jgi:hypothetical protein